MDRQPVTLPRELPVTQHSHVLVVGGGPGGIGAAVAAARHGTEVLLVEHYGFLGGMATAGEVNPFMPNHLDNESLDQGIYTEWVERMAAYGGLRSVASRVFDPNVARLAAEDMCLEAGVRLLYHHRAAHVEMRQRRIEGVVLHSKSGLTGARGRVVVDATGDGDVAALAGARFQFGSETSGHAQPMTLCFKLKLDRRDAPADAAQSDLYLLMREQMGRIQEVYTAAKAAGRIECPRENVLVFRGVDDDVVHFNTTRVILRKATDGVALSEAEIEARRQLRQIVKVLQEEVPLFRHARIHSIAPQIGIRESRRIVGRACVTLEDYKVARRYPDAVARVTYPIDIHNPSGTGTTIEHLPKGQWYEIPFEALLPADVDNLVVGSRCISVDHAVHSSMRVMPPVCSLGQAAGTAAALAVRQGLDVWQVERGQLRQRLLAQGRNLVAFAEPGAASAGEAVAAQAARGRAANFTA